MTAGVEGLLRTLAPQVLGYEMAGDDDRAVRHYTAAARRATSTPEQQYLTIRAAGLRSTNTRQHE